MVTDASCGNNNGTITITGNGGATPYSYSIDGIHFQNSNIFSGLAPGDYTVSLKDLNGKPAQITVTVNSGCLQPISLVLSTTDENCGRKNGTISVTATGGTAPYQYSLNGTDFQDEPVFSQLASGNYTITVKDILGNSVKKDTAITNLEGPPAKIFVGNDTSVLAGQPVPLHISDLGNSGFTQFTWSPAEGLNNPASSDPVAVLQHNITYTATAWADEGCPAVDSISIKVFTVADIFVPNAFTPNGDNRNDILRAIPVGIREFKYFAVYSRLGQRLFYTADPGKGWTGIINGRPELTGAYVWMAAGIDYSGQLIERRGTVILIR
jgi:gliding motility-associated-like protein